MNIIFVSFYSGHVDRGAEVVVSELAQRLGKKHAITVIQSGPRRKTNTNYETIILPFAIDLSKKDQRMHLKKRFFLDKWSILIGKFTYMVLPKLSHADVVVPVDGGWEALLIRLWAWKNYSKVVITGHSGPKWDDRINLLVHPDAFVALTNFQSSWARKNGLGTKVVKIPNGVDLASFSPKGKPTSVNLPRPVIIAVGALEKTKRLDLVIKALAKVKKGSLLILGDGPEKETLSKLAQKLIPERFKIEKVPHDQIPRFYRSADLFTLPAAPWEPFGLVYLEAMATNLPIVAPLDPVRKEIIGDGGLLTDVQDPSAYAATIEKALKRNWGNHPRRQAEKFSWDKVAGQYDRLFRSFKAKGTLS